MLVVRPEYRTFGIATQMISRTVEHMSKMGCKAIQLESEVSNKAALSLYSAFGFLRDTRLLKYYYHGNDAYKVVMNLPSGSVES